MSIQFKLRHELNALERLEEEADRDLLFYQLVKNAKNYLHKNSDATPVISFDEVFANYRPKSAMDILIMLRTFGGLKMTVQELLNTDELFEKPKDED